MNLNKKEFFKRDPTDLAQELLCNVNGIWRELTMKSKPRADFVEAELSKLKSIVNELHQRFCKGKRSE